MRTIGYRDASTSLTAAGSSQSDALELIAAYNEVTTVSSGSGVILYSSLAPGDTQTVYNAGANALRVYPPSSMKINSLSTNAAMLLGTNTTCEFSWVSATRIVGDLSA